ncbi:MAG: hypothetical protein E7446_06575 [Ruminococcaceae bacterium]|nr:hypothetical protein [Oscillospiraceae bacterium]
MAKFDIRTSDPARYEKVKTEQERLAQKYGESPTTARICPFCEQKLLLLAEGHHGSAKMKCPSCNEWVNLPPITVGSA